MNNISVIAVLKGKIPIATDKRHVRRNRRLKMILVVVMGSFLAFIGLVIMLAFVVDRKVQFRKTDAQIRQFFGEKGLRGTIGYYTVDGRTIRYVSIGDDSLPVLFFIHGSPSSLSIYDGLFTDPALRGRFRMVAVDRPGYGNSGFGIAEPSIERQASMLWPLLRSLRQESDARQHPNKIIMIGGSYGTAVVSRLIIDHPGSADDLVLIGPTLGPGLEKTFSFAHLVESPLVHWAVPRLFRVANTEKLAHSAGLTNMLPLWKKITVPVFYLQGSEDHLVYTSNADFARTHLVCCPYLHIEFLPGRPHFFIHSDQAAIVQTILAAYQKINTGG